MKKKTKVSAKAERAELAKAVTALAAEVSSLRLEVTALRKELAAQVAKAAEREAVLRAQLLMIAEELEIV